MRTTRRSKPRQGFTLVELLMVVMIIAILVAILMPVIISVINQAKVAKTQSRIANLATGATTFRLDYGFVPGQSDSAATWPAGADNATYSLMRTKLDGGALTGSQALARALFSDKGDGANFPKSNYAQFQVGETLDTIAGKANTIVDCWPKGQTKAICYYPSRGAGGGLGQFKESDNTVYTNGNTSGATFSAAITHPSTGGPYNDGEFVLFAAGQDGYYFTSDDPTNFGGQ